MRISLPPDKSITSVKTEFLFTEILFYIKVKIIYISINNECEYLILSRNLLYRYIY